MGCNVCVGKEFFCGLELNGTEGMIEEGDFGEDWRVKERNNENVRKRVNMGCWHLKSILIKFRISRDTWKRNKVKKGSSCVGEDISHIVRLIIPMRPGKDQPGGDSGYYQGNTESPSWVGK